MMTYKNNTEVLDPRLGRIEEFDPRSKNHPLTLTPKTPRSYTWRLKKHLDQGQEPTCCGHGWAHERIARPVEVLDVTHEDAVEYYRAMQEVDEWPGHDYSGTSVLAGAKVMQQLGYITGYKWTFALNEMLVGLTYHGPGVLGLPWPEGMSNPDKNGIVRPTGRIMGGHCIMMNGYNLKTRLVRLSQSWGEDHGVNGDIFILDTDLWKLMVQGGECCFPLGRKK